MENAVAIFCTGYFYYPPIFVAEENILWKQRPCNKINAYRDKFVICERLPKLECNIYISELGAITFELNSKSKQYLIGTRHSISQDLDAKNIEERIRPTQRFVEIANTFNVCIFNNAVRSNAGVLIQRMMQVYSNDFFFCNPKDQCISRGYGGKISSNLKMRMEQYQTFDHIHFEYVPKNLVELAISEFKEVLNKDNLPNSTNITDLPSLTSMISLTNSASIEYNLLEFGQSIIQSFAVIEALCFHWWMEIAVNIAKASSDFETQPNLLQGLKTNSTKKIAKSWLKSYQNNDLINWHPSISYIINALNEKEIIPSSLFNKIDRTRIARNRWIHSKIMVNLEDVEYGLDAASGLIKERYQYEMFTSNGCNLVHLQFNS